MDLGDPWGACGHGRLGDSFVVDIKTCWQSLVAMQIRFRDPDKYHIRYEGSGIGLGVAW